MAELRSRMSSLEWAYWKTYYRRREQAEELARLKAEARAKRR